MWVAHRAAWDEEIGPIPDGMHVLHHCDNPPCVRRSHLFLGTHADNMKDKMNKGRGNQKGMPGERNPSVVLSDREVQQIRKEYAEGGVTQETLGKKYGVHQVHISRLVRQTRRKMRGLESI